MDLFSLQTIVIKLMAVIAVTNVGEPISAPPSISFVPAEALQKRVCGRPCPAYAVFLPRHGILMDDRLDPVKDVNARGILLHELVHYVQWRRADRQSAKNCSEWLSREDEAYAIQFRWLAKSISGQQGYPVQRRRRVVCVDPEKETVARRRETAASKTVVATKAN